ncbi:MAG TPA: 4-(cytidine 5'-diphospho)-2-C-methyl-D-erythritol kinase [Pyrinomonadaceae bacterium]|nr:4-(cytidine 5'-diphospho)-2-C-methyl-D-erythritol kinase [Pyrinomonadaceae bacterium]
MQLQAFAKINLDLRILGRRDDGYHEVRTILQTIDWPDEIRMEPAERFEFVEHGVEAGEDNLVVKAVRAFENLTGNTVRARIELFKHVPAGAGLGGGSADAAVTLLGLQRLLGQDIPQSEMLQALGAIGSDIPFFIFGGQALGTGRGNEITPLEDDADDADYALLVVVPEITISTREAYSWLTTSDKSNTIKRFCGQQVSSSAEAERGNDFESVVFPRHPLLRTIKNELLGAGARRAALSGTGSAIFGVFGSAEEAERAVPRVASLGKVKVTRPLSRPEYLRKIWGVAKW